MNPIHSSNSRSFPLINELPQELIAYSWKWDTMPETTAYADSSFWVGTDPDKNKWLVKMHGSFYSFRERTFAALVQRLGLSCQSSVYLRLPSNSLPIQRDRESEAYQLAIWWIETHDKSNCTTDCPIIPLYNNLNDPKQDNILALQQSSVINAIDMAKAEILAYLCGANEMSEFLYTPKHELIMIDNEQMFASFPVNLLEAPILKAPNGDISPAGMEVAIELCNALAKITNSEIGSLATVPENYKVDELWDIKPRLIAARDDAIKFINFFGSKGAGTSRAL